MYETYKIGDTVDIRVLLFDGENVLTGETVAVTIERLSDGQYYTGSAWQSGHTTINMPELTGNIHKEGVYEYSFTTETDAAGNVYDWSVKFEVGAFRRRFRGRISTQWNAFTLATTEPTGIFSDTATPLDIVAFQGIVMRNKITVTATALDLHNNAGSSIAASALSDDATTFTKGEFA